MNTKLFQLLLTVVGLLGTLNNADAAPSKRFDQQIKTLADKIQDAFTSDVKLKDKQLKLGKFACLDDADVNSGKKIERALAAQLVKLINPESKLALVGEYTFVTSKDDVAEGAPSGQKMKVVRITLKLRLDGQELLSLTEEVNDTDDIQEIMSITSAPPVGGNQHQRNESLRQSHEKPTVNRDGSKISIDDNYPVKVEMALKERVDGRATPAISIIKNGKPFIIVHPNQYYELTVYNELNAEIAVTVSIDGLDTLKAFNLDAVKPTYYIIPAKGTRVIRGWLHSQSEEAFKANKSILGFLVGELGQGSPTPVKRTEDIGVINFGIHASWEKGKEPPSEVLKLLSRSAKQLETKAGDGLPEKSVMVQREISPRLGLISLRYGAKD